MTPKMADDLKLFLYSSGWIAIFLAVVSSAVITRFFTRRAPKQKLIEAVGGLLYGLAALAYFYCHGR